MQKTKRIYQDTRTQHNLTKLNEDLQDVTRIMTKNMEDLLWRGDSLDRKSLKVNYEAKCHQLSI
jgi:vesicle transport protein SEC22